MPSFFLAFIASALVIGVGRDGLRVARLAAAHGSAGVLYVAILIASIIYASAAAWLAGAMGDILQGPAASLFVAIALGISGLEVLVLKPTKQPTEPTRSLGATLLVLIAALLTGAAGFLVMALAVLGKAPLFTAAGGAAGAIAVLCGAAMAAQDWEKLPLLPMRIAGASLLILAALVTGYLALTA